ncbi:hypothetical protein DPMN_045906 [Dreissena polymorpha]|uniref:Uncharacterized protein n=1 Tax=Dreissena polymorpha TaxID=45954 RepID=A0A9D4I1T0_DREPO|nr:hypothetical protein DPMN_045906 [Dreissena polymorpha]
MGAGSLRSIAEQITTFNTLQQLCAQHTIACWSGSQTVHISARDISVTLDCTCQLLIVACTTMTDCLPCITQRTRCYRCKTSESTQVNTSRPKSTQDNPSRPKSTQVDSSRPKSIQDNPSRPKSTKDNPSRPKSTQSTQEPDVHDAELNSAS